MKLSVSWNASSPTMTYGRHKELIQDLQLDFQKNLYNRSMKKGISIRNSTIMPTIVGIYSSKRWRTFYSYNKMNQIFMALLWRNVYRTRRLENGENSTFHHYSWVSGIGNFKIFTSLSLIIFCISNLAWQRICTKEKEDFCHQRASYPCNKTFEKSRSFQS